MVSKSSRRWLREHFKDPYVKQAIDAGYRSRAVYKLLELQKKDRLFKPGMTVIDLGAAPGGWSQVVSQCVGKDGHVFAIDLLPMDPIKNVEIIQGNFSEEPFFQQLLAKLKTRTVDWVLSDMAPNLSGIDTVDQSRSIQLAELALDLALKVLHPNGGFLVKVFQGVGFEDFLQEVRLHFKKVAIRKPEASRSRSREVYILAKK